MDHDEVRREDGEKQLDKILSSKSFLGSDRSDIKGKRLRASPRASELLRFLVTETLNGRPPSEASLQMDFYNRDAFDELDAIVRVNVFNLKIKLTEYYVTEGINDLVSIDILGSYKVVFKYRNQASPDKELARGFYQINLEDPGAITRAIEHFEKAIEQGGGAEAYAGKAMALCTRTLHDVTASPEELLPQAEESVKKARAIDENSWLAHAALGGIHAFRREWGHADQAFRKALAIDSTATMEHGAYGLYLLGRGDYKAAKELAKHDEEMFPDKVIFLKRAAFYRYLMREFVEAERILDELAGLESRLWHAHHLHALICLATNRPDKALSHVRQMTELGDSTLWPGLHIVCLQQSGRSDEARQLLDRLLEASGTGYVQPLQLAMGYMALGDPVLAVDRLAEGAKQRDPHMLLLHLWPFLDPIREHPRFKDLLRQYAPPKGLPPRSV